MFQQLITLNNNSLWVILTFVIVFIAVYIYTSLAWMAIAKKKNHPYPWLAWIPFANIGLLLQLGGFNWKWVFLLLIPFLSFILTFIILPLSKRHFLVYAIGMSTSIVLSFAIFIGFLIFLTIAHWRIFKSLRYPEWLALSLLFLLAPELWLFGILPYLIAIGYVAWGKNK